MSKRSTDWPLLISIAATVISLIGLVFGYQANELAKAQYKQDRMLVLKGMFSETDNTSIKVQAISDNAHFQRGVLFFPPSIHQKEVPIDSNGKFWHMGLVTGELEDFFLDVVKPEEGIMKISNGDIPIIIKSYYVSNGIAYTDESLYLLGMQVTLNDKEYSRPEIRYNSLSFVERNEDNGINQNVLDSMIESKSGIYIPARTP